MATKKAKQSSTGVADANVAIDEPLIRPPGKVRTDGSSSATKSKPTSHGVERLRVLMNLSKQCTMTQLCNDAAIELDQLRELVGKQPRKKPFKVEERAVSI